VTNIDILGSEISGRSIDRRKTEVETDRRCQGLFKQNSGTVAECSRLARDRQQWSRAFQFGPKKILFDSIHATESIFSIRFGNLINLPLVHK